MEDRKDAPVTSGGGEADSSTEPPVEFASRNSVEAETRGGQKEEPLEEGRDFYWEGAYLVFTAEYLMRRGYCCHSGCRHCPYGFVKENAGG